MTFSRLSIRSPRSCTNSYNQINRCLSNSKMVSNLPVTNVKSTAVSQKDTDDESRIKLEKNYKIMKEKTAQFKIEIMADRAKKTGERRFIEIDPNRIEKALQKADENHKRSIYG